MNCMNWCGMKKSNMPKLDVNTRSFLLLIGVGYAVKYLYGQPYSLISQGCVLLVLSHYERWFWPRGGETYWRLIRQVGFIRFALDPFRPVMGFCVGVVVALLLFLFSFLMSTVCCENTQQTGSYIGLLKWPVSLASLGFFLNVWIWIDTELHLLKQRHSSRYLNS